MCGIVGFIGQRSAAPLLLESLRRLEYRGYDSAGLATLSNGKCHRLRAQGKLDNLAQRLNESPLPGFIGIGHTRWATHGGADEKNAHPHISKGIAVVHNGIIENHLVLRSELEQHGFQFSSETDTEVIAHLISYYLHEGFSFRQAVDKSLKRLIGAFSIAVLYEGDENIIIGARSGTPLAVGYGTGEMFLASDSYALAPLTDRISFLEDGDKVEITQTSARIFDQKGLEVSRSIRTTAQSGALTGKGDYPHFMLKEMYEQPGAIADTLNSFINSATAEVYMPSVINQIANRSSRITISACGTAYYAGLVAKYWLEKIARIGIDVDVASEFRYRTAPLDPGGTALFISQSGETLDTLEALRYAKRQNQKIISILNTIESTIERESDLVLHTLAGPEIGVASTKAFTTQLTILACLTLAVAKSKGGLDLQQEKKLTKSLISLPSLVGETLSYCEKTVPAIAKEIAQARDVLFMGRGTSYPIALEGALKLKEISYIHAQGYPAGEMKHGPLALVDQNVPVVVVAPTDELFEKTVSNAHEVLARGGKILMISDKNGLAQLKGKATWSIEVPSCNSFITPILYVVTVQFLAYHVAVLKGTDIDRPRNLAKSVTVE